MRMRPGEWDTTEPSYSTMPVNIWLGTPRSQVDADVVAQGCHADDPPAPDVRHGGGSRTGEQPAGVVAAEQDGGQVEHVGVDQPGPVEGAGHGRPALDEQLHDTPGAEVVEDVAEVALDLEARVHLGTGRRPAEDDPQRVRPLDVADGQLG